MRASSDKYKSDQKAGEVHGGSEGRVAGVPDMQLKKIPLAETVNLSRAERRALPCLKFSSIAGELLKVIATARC